MEHRQAFGSAISASAGAVAGRNEAVAIRESANGPGVISFPLLRVECGSMLLELLHLLRDCRHQIELNRERSRISAHELIKRD